MTELESPGITVESAFVNDGATRAVVIVQRVVLNSGSSLAKPPAVVKYSERQYALPHSRDVQLATPRFYRNYPSEDLGIRDEEEASYIKRIDLKKFLSLYSPQLSSLGMASEQGSADLTLARDDCWIFCTSLKPATEGQAGQLGRQFSDGYDCATVIEDASEFARELGATFGAHVRDADLNLNGLDILAKYRMGELGETMVRVYHGQVLYTDAPAAIVESYPDDRRAAIVPFLKRSQYAYQQEYRYVVVTHGGPKEQVLRLPISEDLRTLTEEWDL
ncbi:MAG: hypothetical protein F4Y96_03600 [Chloroflexi bacterium]|nr:hypothetical protein [Chloroflexota bacterium]